MGFRKEHRGGKKFGGRKSFGKQGFGEKSATGGPPLHKAICSDCNMECFVPFKPSGDKPVLCRRCFKGKGDSGPRKFEKKDFGDRHFEKRDFEKITQDQFKTLNSKLDQIIKMLHTQL